jgi:hypothetical protein
VLVRLTDRFINKTTDNRRQTTEDNSQSRLRISVLPQLLQNSATSHCGIGGLSKNEVIKSINTIWVETNINTFAATLKVYK